MTSLILLVRHAHAGERDEWDSDDSARPLSLKGRAQAQSLRSVLFSYAPNTVLSSPAIRCVQTVGPIADAIGRPIELESALAEGSTNEAVDLIREQGGRAVLCTHGDVIPEVLKTLQLEDNMKMPAVKRCAKASVWVLKRADTGWEQPLYIEAPGA